MAAITDIALGSAEAALSSVGPAWSLSIAESPEAVAGEWQALEQRAVVSPYQRFDLTAAWCRHAAPIAGVEPRIGLVHDDRGNLVMILPFGLSRRRGITVATYLGGSNFNLNLPLLDPAFPLGGSRLVEIIDRYCELTGADLLSLAFQPRSWGGRSHPFLVLRHQPSTDEVRTIGIEGSFESYLESQLSKSTRSKLRRKRRHFEGPDGAAGRFARTAAEVERCVKAFVAQKSRWFAAHGIRDSFVDPAMSAFLRAAGLAGLDGLGGLEFGFIEVAGAIVSVRAGVAHRGHHSLMIQSLDPEHELAKYSPSEVLVGDVLAAARSRGVTSFDFGVGDGHHKQVWSNGVTELFDITYPASLPGLLHAVATGWRTRAVRFIKHNELLFSGFKALRTFRRRR